MQPRGKHSLLKNNLYVAYTNKTWKTKEMYKLESSAIKRYNIISLGETTPQWTKKCEQKIW